MAKKSAARRKEQSAFDDEKYEGVRMSATFEYNELSLSRSAEQLAPRLKNSLLFLNVASLLALVAAAIILPDLTALLIALFACLLGIAIGVLVAVVRTTWDSTCLTMRRGPGRLALSLLNRICLVYTTVIRGTPVVVQLLIMYYIIFASSNNGLMVASLAFGINSGAYVSEIIRSGILSVDKGQMEAGRSLGLTYL